MAHMDFQEFCNPLEQSRLVWEPWAEANRQAAVQMQRLWMFQIDAWGRYLDFGLGRMQAAARVHDVQTLLEFWSGQVQAAAELRQLLLNDAEDLAVLAAELRAGSVAPDYKLVDEVSGKAAAPGKAAAGKAA